MPRLLTLYADFIAQVKQELAHKEKEYRALVRECKKNSSNFEYLQLVGEKTHKCLNKINKLHGILDKDQAQMAAINQALESQAISGNYELTLTQAVAIIANFSQPAKMPGFGYSIPAIACITGSYLRTIVNSVCYKCYALKGNYQYWEVKACLFRRLRAIHYLDLWKCAFSLVFSSIYVDGKTTIGKKDNDLGYFRWHDSGDIQSIEHLAAIVEIAKQFPGVTFWLPTKERKFVSKYLESHDLPLNMTIRVSMPMIGQKAKEFKGLPVSTVDGDGFKCKAPKQQGSCLDCRACWQLACPVVTYHEH